VDALDKPVTALATKLLAQITPDQVNAWAQGTPDDWAMETFAVSQLAIGLRRGSVVTQSRAA
jgi:hypothetical protein